jgi:hypothetical protein
LDSLTNEDALWAGYYEAHAFSTMAKIIGEKDYSYLGGRLAFKRKKKDIVLKVSDACR